MTYFTHRAPSAVEAEERARIEREREVHRAKAVERERLATLRLHHDLDREMEAQATAAKERREQARRERDEIERVAQKVADEMDRREAIETRARAIRAGRELEAFRSVPVQVHPQAVESLDASESDPVAYDEDRAAVLGEGDIVFYRDGSSSPPATLVEGPDLPW